VPVYYTFPLARNYRELEQKIPGIADHTILVRVRDMPIETVLDCKPHIVEIVVPNNNPNNATVTVYSAPKKLQPGSYTTLTAALKEIAEKKLPPASQHIHLTQQELQQVLEEELQRRISEEKVEPELAERAERLAKAIVTVSFTYRGTGVAAKPERTSRREPGQ
jgi:hypothetical protein